MNLRTFFFILITTSINTIITPSDNKTSSNMTPNDLYLERMKVVELERRWVDEHNLANQSRAFAPTITPQDIKNAHDTFEQLEADWKLNASFRSKENSNKPTLQRKNSSPPSNSSFFDAIVNSPLFKRKK